MPVIKHVTFIIKDVKMTLEVEEDYVENANFEMMTTVACTDDVICFEKTKDSDSITFNGKLTKNFTEYKVTLQDNTNFTFTFGTNSTSPPISQSTAEPTTLTTKTVQPEPQPEPATKDPSRPQPGTDEPERTNSSNESENDQDTVPTTSSARLNIASAATLLICIAVLPF